MIFLRRAGCQSRMIFGRAIIPLRFLFVRDLFRKPVPTFRDHALVSRFRSSHHCAAHSFANFGIKGTLAIYDSSAVFGFEVPTQTRGYNDRNFKSTALGEEIGAAIMMQKVGFCLAALWLLVLAPASPVGAEIGPCVSDQAGVMTCGQGPGAARVVDG